MKIKKRIYKFNGGKNKKLKIGNGLNKDTILGPLTTKQRLEGVEKLVEKRKRRGQKFY